MYTCTYLSVGTATLTQSPSHVCTSRECQHQLLSPQSGRHWKNYRLDCREHITIFVTNRTPNTHIIYTSIGLHSSTVAIAKSLRYVEMKMYDIFQLLSNEIYIAQSRVLYRVLRLSLALLSKKTPL